MKTKQVEIPDIQEKTQRDHDGWRAVLEFPNGGRQIFTTRHATMEDALREAGHAWAIRIKFPGGCVRDPMPNEYQDLSNFPAAAVYLRA